jgi:hypothetical protein
MRQVEYLWPAGSFIEQSGPEYTAAGGGGLLTMVPVRINANGKAQTVEELQSQKKDMHVNSFRYLLAETARDLWRIAEDEGAQERLARDLRKEFELKRWLDIGGQMEWLLEGMVVGTQVTFTVAGLLSRIMLQCNAVLERHEDLDSERYHDDEAFRLLVSEMLETRAAAINTLRAYISDPDVMMQTVMRRSITTWHRVYLAFLDRKLPAKGEARVKEAAQLCRAMGVPSDDKADADGLTPLMRAAADGAGVRVLRCLVAAGADVNRRGPEGRTSLFLAALFGHAEVVEALARLGGDVDAVSEPGVMDTTPMWIAAAEGHTAVIEALGLHKADANRAGRDGRTPVYMAAFKGHAAAVEALGRLGVDVERACPDFQGEDPKTPLGVAIHHRHAAAEDALRRLGASS